MFPDDATLIARGKYSTLSHERHEQLKRVQTIAETIVNGAYAVLRDCEAKPPKEPQYIVTLAKCVENITDARDRLVLISKGMNDLEPEAWPK